MGYFSTMIYLTCGKLDLRTIIPDVDNGYAGF